MKYSESLICSIKDFYGEDSCIYFEAKSGIPVAHSISDSYKKRAREALGVEYDEILKNYCPEVASEMILNHPAMQSEEAEKERCLFDKVVNAEMSYVLCKDNKKSEAEFDMDTNRG